jgi:hypothetical protein
MCLNGGIQKATCNNDKSWTIGNCSRIYNMQIDVDYSSDKGVISTAPGTFSNCEPICDNLTNCVGFTTDGKTCWFNNSSISNPVVNVNANYFYTGKAPTVAVTTTTQPPISTVYTFTSNVNGYGSIYTNKYLYPFGKETSMVGISAPYALMTNNLPIGQDIQQGVGLISGNNVYMLVNQTDNYLVLYNLTTKVPVWKSRNETGLLLPFIKTLLNFSITTNTVVSFGLSNDGLFVYYDNKGNINASFNPLAPTSTTTQQVTTTTLSTSMCATITYPYGDTLLPSQTLSQCQGLKSGNKVLYLGLDGNLIWKTDTGIIWMTGTNGKGIGPYTLSYGLQRFSLQNGLDVVLTDGTGKILWTTGTNTKGLNITYNFKLNGIGNTLALQPSMGASGWSAQTGSMTGQGINY